MGALRLCLLVALAVTASACMGPGITVASYVAQAAVKTAMDYNEKNKPTDDEAWAESRLRSLERKAEAGDPEANFELGRVHLAHERREAQLQMGHWYNEDRLREDMWPYVSLRPDNRKAYLWYGHAAAKGEGMGRLFQDSLLDDQLTAEEAEELDRRLEGWKPGGCPFVVLTSREPEKYDVSER